MGLSGIYDVMNSAGGKCGTLTVSQDGLYTLFDYSFGGTVPPSRLTLISGGNSISLGVPVPAGGAMALRKRMSRSELKRRGISSIDSVYLAGVSENAAFPQNTEPPAPDPGSEGEISERSAPVWTPEPHPEDLFCDMALRASAREQQGVLISPSGDTTLVAFPYRRGARFPLMPAFRSAMLGSIGGSGYVIYRVRGGKVI